MTYSEEAIYRHLTEKDEPIVEKYLHLMMDVDHFFNSNEMELKYTSTYDFPSRQIDNFEKINIKYANLIGFVAFNPARENSLEIVKNAIEKRGFKGIKFYPPLGYRAYNDPVYETKIDAHC